jgi:nucleoid-associated protein YgaU
MARAALPWVAATVIVLAAAVAAGFLVAYLVASGRAVDPGSGLQPTPRRSAAASLGAGSSAAQSGAPTQQPRRTPGAPTPEPTPIEHVVVRGEFLSYIAGLYCTTVDEILELNDIQNPNRIQPGDVLMIPGGGCSSPPPTPG